MRYIIICDDEFPFYLTQKETRREILFLCEKVQFQKRLIRWGAKCRYGNIAGKGIYQRHKVCSTDRISVFIRDAKKRSEVLQAVMDYTDAFAITLIEEFNAKTGLLEKL